MTQPISKPTEVRAPAQWAAAVVAQSMHCRTCGYDLRELQAGGRCPECGQPIWATVLHTVDSAASRLPSLRNPRAVGNAMLGLTLVMLIGTILLVMPTVAAAIDSWNAAGVNRWSARLPKLEVRYAAVLGIMGFWALWTLAPPRGTEPPGAVWIDLWRILIGMVGWLAGGATWTALHMPHTQLGRVELLLMHIITATFAAVGLLGLRGVFRIIGERSREYRLSRGGRQSLELIIVAMALGVVASIGRFIGGERWLAHEISQWLVMASTVVLWITSFMVVIGVTYLAINAGWIRRSLRGPPPPLDQVLVQEMPTDTWIPDREE